MTPALRARLEQLIVAWRSRAAEASRLSEHYSQTSDDAGNAFAFLKERRVWSTAADDLEGVLASLDAPQEPHDW